MPLMTPPKGSYLYDGKRAHKGPVEIKECDVGSLLNTGWELAEDVSREIEESEPVTQEAEEELQDAEKGEEL